MKRENQNKHSAAVRAGLGALVAGVLLTGSGCVLALVPLLATPVAVGSGVAATAVGTRTAYYHAKDFYDAIDQQDGTRLAGGETIEGVDLVKMLARGEAAFSRAIQPYGIDTPDYVVLNELKRRGASTQAAISRNTGIADFPTNPQMNRLVQRGLVSPTSGAGQSRFELSQAGRDLVERTRPVAEHVRFEFNRRLSLQERQVLAKLSAKAVAETDSKATLLAGGVLGVNTDGAAEFVLAKNLLASRLGAEKLLNPHNLNRVEFEVLTAVWEKPELGLRQLSQSVRGQRPEIEAAVSGLVQKGYVNRLDQPSEDGPWKLLPAPRGVALQQTMKGQADQYTQTLFARLSEEERRDMQAVLSKMGRGVI